MELVRVDLAVGDAAVAARELRPHRRAGRSVVAFVLRGAALAAVLVLAAAAGRRAIVRLDARYLAATAPPVAEIEITSIYFDTTPVPLRTTAGWDKVWTVATRDAVRSDVILWGRMNFDDWDTVAPPLQHEALDAMLQRYRYLLASPAEWDRMTPDDWDFVPQPIRALAFRHMVEYWSGYYQVGVEYGIPRGTMADTMAALIMSESWFNHRAVNVNPWGNRDLGVAQAADSTRRTMADLYRKGMVDVRFEDRDYFDPWKGTRFIAIWMGLLLDEVNGDLDTAIRAYHRGAPQALRGEGAEYLEAAKRRLHTFIRDEARSGAWDYLWRQDQRLVRAARPWLVRDAMVLQNGGDVMRTRCRIFPIAILTLALSPIAVAAQGTGSAAVTVELTKLLDARHMDVIAAARSRGSRAGHRGAVFSGQPVAGDPGAVSGAAAAGAAAAARTSTARFTWNSTAPRRSRAGSSCRTWRRTGSKPTCGADQPFDSVSERGAVQTTFDGDWKGQGLSEADYRSRFAAADARYARMVGALVATLKAGTSSAPQRR